MKSGIHKCLHLTFKSLKRMDQVKSAWDQIQSNGFYLAQPARTLKSQENCAKKEEVPFLPFSKHSATIHKPWASRLIKPNANLSEAYSMWSSARVQWQSRRLVSGWLQYSPMWFTQEFWLSTIPPLTGIKQDHFVLFMLQSCSTFRVGKYCRVCSVSQYHCDHNRQK